MKLTEKERTEAFESLKEYWEELDDAGIFLVLGTARFSWEQSRTTRDADAEQLAAAEVRKAAQITKKVIPFPRRV